MGKWGIWALAVVGALVLLQFDYLWQSRFMYWVRSWVDSIMGFIWRG